MTLTKIITEHVLSLPSCSITIAKGDYGIDIIISHPYIEYYKDIKIGKELVVKKTVLWEQQEVIPNFIRAAAKEMEGKLIEMGKL